MEQIYEKTYQFSLREVFKMIYRGDIGSYWFLYAYISLLLILPFIREMKKVLTKANVFYLFLLRIILKAILPMLLFVALGHSMGTLLNVFLVEDSIFYFLIGYSLDKEDYFGKKKIGRDYTQVDYLVFL